MRIVTLAGCLVLVGCGGGSGGDTDNTTDTQTGIVETQSNQPSSIETETPDINENSTVVDVAIDQLELPEVAGFYSLRAEQQAYTCVGGPALENPFGPSLDNVIISQSDEIIAIEYDDGLILNGTVDNDRIFEATAMTTDGSVDITYDLAGTIEENGFWSGQLSIALDAGFGYVCTTTPFFSGQRGEVITADTQPVAPVAGECVDTLPLGDGFGWNGVETCSLPIAPTATPFADKNCSDFSTQGEAQTFFENNGPNDPHVLDLDSDGLACECNVGGGGWAWCPVETPVAPTTPTTPFVDRNCMDFETHAEAQAFFISEGGPTEDPHDLDGNGDGLVCVGLP